MPQRMKRKDGESNGKLKVKCKEISIRYASGEKMSNRWWRRHKTQRIENVDLYKIDKMKIGDSSRIKDKEGQK